MSPQAAFIFVAEKLPPLGRSSLETRMKPLKNIKVLDLSKVIAGPLCAQYLGELGADVIKVEAPGAGDDTRLWQPQDQGISATFLSVNHNKRSLTLDLKNQQALAVSNVWPRRLISFFRGSEAGPPSGSAWIMNHSDSSIHV